MTPYPDWDQGLTIDVLALVAAGRDDLKAMRGASKTWRAGYELSVSTVHVDADGPNFPVAFAQRFSGLKSVVMQKGPKNADQRQILMSVNRLNSLTVHSMLWNVSPQSPALSQFRQHPGCKICFRGHF